MDPDVNRARNADDGAWARFLLRRDGAQKEYFRRLDAMFRRLMRFKRDVGLVLLFLLFMKSR